VVVCLPKHDRAQTTADYRPITLLNDDYKRLACILARHLRPLLADYVWKTILRRTWQLHLRRFFDRARRRCMVVGDAHPFVRPVSGFSRSFRQGSHRYLFTVLKAYGLHEWFVYRIQHLYQDDTSSVHINGHIAGTLPLRCSVREGCPLNLAPFALCVNPLLHYLNTHLQGSRLGRNGYRTANVAYADVTIFVTKHYDFRVIRDAIQLYEKTSVTRLNVHTSNTMAVGGWNGTPKDLGVDFVPHIRTLGVTFSNKTEGTADISWSRTTEQVKAQAQQACGRNLSLAQRINYVHSTLLALNWYASKALSPPESCSQQLTTALSLYLWRVATFRVPLPTLQKPKAQGGWALFKVAVKCYALLLRRLWLQSHKEGTVTAE
jgi:hypothetical protein